AAGIGVNIRPRGEGDIDEGVAVEVEESPITLEGAQVFPCVWHLERILDPEFTRFLIDLTDRIKLAEPIMGL
ncbi:MAG: hypothetical protein QNK82_05390, partial [Akkermansiaceae bacterium]